MLLKTFIDFSLFEMINNSWDENWNFILKIRDVKLKAWGPESTR